MSKLATLIFFTLTIAVVARAAAVTELDISGNAAGSDNGIVIQSGSSINVQQGNSIDLLNQVDASANTGGNSASGNDGEGTIITGDATTEVEINNFFNQNKTKIDSKCCPTPTSQPRLSPLPTPTTTPPIGGAQPTVTPTSSPTNPGPTGNGDGGGPGPAGGGQVLGLAAAAGPVSLAEYAFYLAASLCLSGAKLLRVRS